MHFHTSCCEFATAECNVFHITLISEFVPLTYNYKHKKKKKNNKDKTNHPTGKPNKRYLCNFYPCFSKLKSYRVNQYAYYDTETGEHKNNKEYSHERTVIHCNFTTYILYEAQAEPEATPPARHTGADLPPETAVPKHQRTLDAPPYQTKSSHRQPSTPKH